jgi:hypothetical protein
VFSLVAAFVNPVGVPAGTIRPVVLETIDRTCVAAMHVTYRLTILNFRNPAARSLLDP